MLRSLLSWEFPSIERKKTRNFDLTGLSTWNPHKESLYLAWTWWWLLSNQSCCLQNFNPEYNGYENYLNYQNRNKVLVALFTPDFIRQFISQFDEHADSGWPVFSICYNYRLKCGPMITKQSKKIDYFCNCEFLFFSTISTTKNVSFSTLH